MAKFQTSSFGRLYVTSEEFTEFPVIRQAFVLITSFLGTVILLKLLHLQFVTLRSSSNVKPSTQNRTNRMGAVLFFLYFLSYTIHVVHYADNIYRPVDYFEPKWLYVKYVLSEMEITFFVNFPISIVGYINIVNLLAALQLNDGPSIRKSCKRLTFYVIGSLLTLGHYRTEPPAKYSAFVNFTIAGEGIVTILFSIALWIAWKRAKPDTGRDSKQERFTTVNKEEVENLLEDDTQMRGPRPSGTRRRSKTPIG